MPPRNHGYLSAYTIVAVKLPSAVFEQLEQSSGLRVLPCDADPAAVVELCGTSIPCIVVADQSFILSLPARWRQKLHEQRARIHTAAVYAETCDFTELVRLGCSGAIPASIGSEELLRAMNALVRGELWYPRMVLSDAIRSLVSPCQEQVLTPREQEILQMISQGHNNAEIAKALFISRETVRWHQRSLYSKIGTRDRKQVAAVGKQRIAS